MGTFKSSLFSGASSELFLIVVCDHTYESLNILLDSYPSLLITSKCIKDRCIDVFFRLMESYLTMMMV
jgi:hypothetical protein